ncbi:FecR family protein [Gaoshiqia sp. Z1-71]|uniref:FecR family protein n=1 Tax=Gaoshiqia hydrogeniformans TaxID=3290090 RepID=UPI003BF865A5
MKEKNQIPDYMFACLHGQADKEQKDLAEAWLKVAENRLVYEQIIRINKLSDDLKLFERFNLKEGKIAVDNQIRKAERVRTLVAIQRVAAILLLPVLLFGVWHFVLNVKMKQDFASVQVIQEVRTQPGVRSSFLLPDGTKVWLNTASVIKFPSVFNGDTRSIELDGEAYFEVFPNKKKPFMVKSDAIEIVALGTAFNFSAYSDDSRISATLIEGSVKVTSREGNGEGYILEPNEQLNFEKNLHQISKNRVNTDDVIAWKEGKLIFNETPFHEVVLKLGRWFNTDIQLADHSLDTYRYTATFTNETLLQVTELLSLSAPIEVTSVKREFTGDSDFTKAQIIIRAKPNAKNRTKEKNEKPMKQR